MTKRLLAPHEAAIAAAGVRVVLHSDIKGDVDETVLTQALDRLHECYPLLGGRIVTEADNGLMVRIDATTTGPELTRGTHFDEEISTPLAWDRTSLLRLRVLPGRGGSRVVMTLPRAFVDATCYLAVHARLWALYSALATGRPVPVERVEPVLAPALDDVLSARFTDNQLREFVAERARLDAQAAPALLPALAAVHNGPGPNLSFGITAVEAGSDHCERLAQRAKDASLTLNALVSGILLTSLRSVLPAPDGPVRMLCTTAVDMRRRLSPLLPAKVLQSAATTTSIRLDIDEHAHPVEVGHDLNALLRADLDSGAAAMELAAFPYMLDQHPPTLVITNVGSITGPDLPNGLEITNVRIAPLGHVPMLFAVVSRYQGRLAVDLTYSRAWYTDTQIQELADRVSDALVHVTR
ncbi:condensation protein [Streptomyces sp. CA-278952]|uniref:phthiocerol/phthiodiolone dimycocerosyl transferase family protein n=2 Tax=unclassified Streptomyces TaxID=2593676 RepID=UPI00236788A1|nr:condensation protein [Streptomyces sp. CA-278952]WDG32557.1 condensation protein [Streptomyces sp. CA-278952]